MSRFIVEKQLRVSGGAKGDIIARGSSSFDNLAVGPNGQVLTADSTQSLGVKWAAAPITSVFTRGGAVVAVAGDYTASQVTNVPAGSIAATDVQAAINELDTEKAATGHTHTLDNLSDVTIAAAANGEVLTFNSVSGEWENQAPTGGIADPGANGILARTALNVTAARTLTAGSTKLSITNGDGVSGNPTFDVVEANLSHANIGGVTAIANGGTGQTTATAAFAALSPLTTKGDLLTRDASGNVRKAVGADGQALVASSASADGLAWQTLGGTVPSGTQGQKLSFGAGNVLSARDWVVLAEDYGAVGDGVADDTGALSSALAAVAGTGRTLWLSKTYKVTSTISVTSGNFTLDGGGTIKVVAPAATTVRAIQIVGSDSATVTGFNETVTRATAETAPVTDLDVDSATGFAVGDYVRLEEQTTNEATAQVSRIQAIVSNNVAFTDSIGIPVTATQTNTFRKLNMLSGIKIRNLTFDGSSSSGADDVRGLRMTHIVDSIVENVRFIGFEAAQGTVAGGFTGNSWYNVQVRNLTCQDCGTAGLAAMQITWASNSGFDGMFATSGGFHLQLVQSSFCQGDRWISVDATGRAIKIAGVAWSQFGSIIANNSQTATGLSITNGSFRNTFDSVTANNNKVSQGVWFSGQNNDRNWFKSIVALGNASQGLNFAATDDNNFVENLYTDSFSDSGSGNFVHHHVDDKEHLLRETRLPHLEIDISAGGQFDDVNVDGVTYVRTSGAAATTITGFTGGADGRLLILTTGANLTIADQNAGSALGNRINTQTGANVTTTGAGSFIFVYDPAGNGSWRIVSQVL